MPFLASTPDPSAADDKETAQAEAKELEREGFKRGRESFVKSSSSPAELSRIANDMSLGREKRIKAIFSLFANHLKQLPANQATVAKVLNGQKWLDDTNLRGIYVLGGWVPVRWTFDDTVFCLYLCPDKSADGWSDSVIYFRLSDDKQTQASRSVKEAGAFLRGDLGGVKGNPKLMEFALCFPGKTKQELGRIERFTANGFFVMEGH